MIFAAIPAALFFGLSLAILNYAGFGFIEILRDPAQQTETSSFLGFLSNIGVFLWIASVAIALFSIFDIHSGSRQRLLILISILSVSLALDDFFLIHDRYINQNISYLFFALVGGLILFLHLKEIRLFGISRGNQYMQGLGIFALYFELIYSCNRKCLTLVGLNVIGARHSH